MLKSYAALIVLFLSTFVPFRTEASDVGDSLRYVLDADATVAERSKALCDLARRRSPHDPASALGNAVSAVRFAEQSGVATLEHDALVVLRDLQLEMGLEREYLASTTRALDLARSLSDPVRIGSDLQALSIAYRMNNRLEQAVEQARMALAIALPSNDPRTVAFAEEFLMETFLFAEMHADVMRLGEQALMHAARAGLNTSTAHVRVLIARSLIMQLKYSDALPYLTTAARSIDQTGGPEDRFGLALDLAAVAIGTQHHAEATVQLERAATLLSSCKGRDRSFDLLRKRYELAAATHNWKQAHDLLHDLQLSLDSLDRRKKDLVLTGLQVIYELERKDKDNDELRHRNAENTALLEDEQVSNRYLQVAAGALLLMAIALFLLSRKAMRSARRSRLKSLVIQRQKDQIHAKNMELQRQNMRLADTLVSEERKDVVLGEIHHRVKNNLQVIDSLLNMQCGSIQDPVMAKLMREAQGRIRAMAQVHVSIHRFGGEESIPTGTHLTELAHSVLVAYGMHDRISIQVDAHDIVLNAPELMPLSLLVNELLTNAVKHAFVARDHGHVHIVLRQSGNAFELIFADDGAGHRDDSPYWREGSFGMMLVEALAQQLNGHLRMLKGAGTTFSLTFQPDGLVLKKAS